MSESVPYLDEKEVEGEMRFLQEVIENVSLELETYKSELISVPGDSKSIFYNLFVW